MSELYEIHIWSLMAIIAVVFLGILIFGIQYSYRNKSADLREIRIVWLIITALAGYPLYETITQGLIPWIIVSAILILFGTFNFCRVQFFWIKKAKKKEDEEAEKKAEEQAKLWQQRVMDLCRTMKCRQDNIRPIFFLATRNIHEGLLQIKKEAEALGANPELIQEILLAHCESIILNDYTKLNRLMSEAQQTPKENLDDATTQRMLALASENKSDPAEWKKTFSKTLLELLSESTKTTAK